MNAYSMDLHKLEKIAKDCERNISMHTSNLLYFLQEEETNVYTISLLTEAYSISSKLLIELNYIIEEASDIEEKDGKIIVPLEEKTLAFIQTALLASVHVSRDLTNITRLAALEV